MYRGHVYFEAVRPDVVKVVLHYLKQNKYVYQDIVIDEAQISSEMLCLQDDQTDTLTEVDELEEQENPLDECSVGANETALISAVPSAIDNENVTIAHCEGKKPMSLLTDSNCEELALPYLFLTGKFGYKNVQRNINLTPSKYFNQRLLNYKQRFASEADYIFFARSVYQQMNMTSSINIAMQKVKTNKLTAGMLSQNFKDTVKLFV